MIATLQISHSQTWSYQESKSGGGFKYVGFKYDYYGYIIIDVTNRTTIEESLFNKLSGKYPGIQLPDIKDCVYFNPAERFEGLSREFENDLFPQYPILPTSVRSILDTADISIKPGQMGLFISGNWKPGYDNYLRPFYFRKYEVTNAEYREFLSFVRDSVARDMLYEGGMKEYGAPVAQTGSQGGNRSIRLNRKVPINWDSKLLEDLYYDEEDSFYGRKEFDPQKFNYRICSDDTATIVINVYPDTLCWGGDFPFSFNEPISRGYFWHPKYKDHPVVGITYWQALAFLDWKTKQHQALLNAKGINLFVRYELPSDIEWEIVTTTKMTGGKKKYFDNDYAWLSDHTWLTDLKLIPETIPVKSQTDSLQDSYRYDELFGLLKTYSRFPGFFSVDGSMYPVQSNPDKIDKDQNKNKLMMINRDEYGICFMGGNVSEWLRDSYAQWKPVFDLRQQSLNDIAGKDAATVSQIEKYFDSKNDINGRLVRGSNWYDERFSNIYGRNPEGTNAKLFVDPARAHATLGFRYVVHFTEKKEPEADEFKGFSSGNMSVSSGNDQEFTEDKGRAKTDSLLNPQKNKKEQDKTALMQTADKEKCFEILEETRDNKTNQINEYQYIRGFRIKNICQKPIKVTVELEVGYYNNCIQGTSNFVPDEKLYEYADILPDEIKYLEIRSAYLPGKRAEDKCNGVSKAVVTAIFSPAN
jgi:formylglycine-generating enzyme required for sulfatase activity